MYEITFSKHGGGVRVSVAFTKIAELLKVEREFSSCDRKFLRDSSFIVFGMQRLEHSVLILIE